MKYIIRVLKFSLWLLEQPVTYEAIYYSLKLIQRTKEKKDQGEVNIRTPNVNTVTHNTARSQIWGTGGNSFLGGTSAAFTKAKLRFIKLCNSPFFTFSASCLVYTLALQSRTSYYETSKTHCILFLSISSLCCVVLLISTF